MKVWRLKFEVDLFDNLEPVNSWPIEKYQSFDGRKHKKDWIEEKVQRMEPWKKLELGDAPGFEIPVFSGRAVNCLASLIQDYVEFLPLESEEGDFYAINITNVLKNAVDYDKSKIIRFSSGRVMTIDEYYFDETVIKNNPIFKIEELKMGSAQFVTEEFVKLVEENNLSGFCFELVWDSEETKTEIENPYKTEYENRVCKLTLEQQKMLEEYDKVFFPFLKIIKEDRNPSIQEGTIFAVQFGKRYCYGKVMCMQTNIPGIPKDNFVVCFFDELSNNLNEYPKQITMQNLLLGPLFIRKIFWKTGFCYTVDHFPLTAEEKNMNIGFFDDGSDGIVKKYNMRGQAISYTPQILTPCIESMLK